MDMAKEFFFFLLDFPLNDETCHSVRTSNKWYPTKTQQLEPGMGCVQSRILTILGPKKHLSLLIADKTLFS